MSTKRVPQRMCIVTREVLPKNELIRVVKTPNSNYELDFTGKLNGRGAYIKNSKEVLEKCVKTRALNRAFKEQISADIYNQLLESYVTRTDKQS